MLQLLELEDGGRLAHAEQTGRAQGTRLERLGNPQGSLDRAGGPSSWEEADSDTRGTWLSQAVGSNLL